MKSSYSELRNRMLRIARVFAIPALTLAFALCVTSAAANAATDSHSQAAESYHVLYLKGVVTQSDARDVETDLRNVLGRARIFYVPSRNAISMISTQHDFEIAQKIVEEMSRGPRVFRLTYTFTNSGGGKGAGKRSVSVVVGSGEHASVKHGEKVPVLTGRDVENKDSASTQVQYIDVGLNLNVWLRGPADDLVLQTRFSESAVDREAAVAGLSEPTILQTALENTSIVTVGKPLVLGSIAVPGSTRPEQIEVTVEPVK